MPTVINSAAALTSAWLTERLRSAGVLPRGEVTAFAVRANSAFNSNVSHLDVTYSGVAPQAAPRYLLLKCNAKAEWASRAGAREVALYNAVALRPDRADRLPMIVPCFDAAYDETSGDSHLLLEDVSLTHRPALTRDEQLTPGANVPAQADIARAVTVLARWHACWWQHPILGANGAVFAAVAPWCSSIESYERYVGQMRDAWNRLCADNADWLPDQVKVIYANLFHGASRLWHRYDAPRMQNKRNLTLTHGDAYFANFLCPRDGAAGETYLVDWQGPETYRATVDMVNLLATFWTREDRRSGQREMKALRLYHDTLLKQDGPARDYRWEELLLDYCLSILDWLLFTLQDFRDGAGRDYWRLKMSCLVAAYEDWKCGALIPDT